MKKKVLIITMLLLLLCGCGKEENDNEFKPQENNNVEKVSIIDTESDTRNYAVMINCHKDALPQAGLDKAHIVYELMVEGGITRMMAIFKDQEVDKIGSVRSARTQYLGYAKENDAIYIHAGAAPDAISQINEDKINDIDVDGKYGFRDKTLKRATEHTLFTSTELLQKGSEDKKIRTTTEQDNLLNYSASELDLSKYDGAKKVNNISIKYSNYRTSNYTYEEDSKTYLRSMNDTKNTDLVTGKQYKVKNILIYSVKYSSYSVGGYGLYQKLDNIGTGEGYYVSNGYAIPITWEKKSEYEQTKYTITATGEELVVNDGNTYIQIYPTTGKLTIN